MKVERDVSVATPKVSADETSMLSKLVALAQWVALLAIPQLFWRPAWASWISVIGGERNANVYGNCALTVATLLAGNAYFYALYVLRAPFFERHKVQADKPWPWESHVPEKDRGAFSNMVRRGAMLTALNVALAIPLGAAGYKDVKRLGYSGAAADFPSAWKMLAQLCAFMVIEDTLFYWGHRLLHGVAYKYIHKVHHTFTFSVSIAAVATQCVCAGRPRTPTAPNNAYTPNPRSPVEYIVSNVIPFVAGPTLLGAHCATIYVWLIFRLSA